MGAAGSTGNREVQFTSHFYYQHAKKGVYQLQKEHVLVWLIGKDDLKVAVAVADKTDLEDGGEDGGEIALSSINKWLPLHTGFTASTGWGEKVFVQSKTKAEKVRVKSCGKEGTVVQSMDIKVRRKDLQACIHCEEVEMVNGQAMPQKCTE